MKNSLTAALTATLILPFSALIAQPSGPGDFARGAAERIEKMKENLDLTDDQVKQVKDLFLAQGEEMKALKDDKSLSDSDRRAKGKSLMEEMRKEVDAILTPEQRAKRDELAPKRTPKDKSKKPDKDKSEEKAESDE